MRSCAVGLTPSSPFKPIIVERQAPAPNTVRWSSLTSSASYSLSADGLTGTRSSGSGDVLLRANTSGTNGYYEIVVSNLTGSANIGVADATTAADGEWVGDNNNSIGWVQDGRVITGGGTLLATWATYTIGDVLGFVWKNGKLYGRKNGGTWQGSADPVAETGGLQPSTPQTVMFPAASTNNSPTVYAGRFSASSISGTLPSGISAWDGSGPVTNAYSLSCTTGTFAITGNAAAPEAARIFTLTAASFTLTGNAVNLLVAMTAARGTFTLTGNAAVLAAAIPASTGVFTLGSSATSLIHGYRLTVTTGALALTGQSALLAVTMPAARGTFTLNGAAANLKAARLVSASTGVFLLSGNAAGLNKVGSSTLVADTGAFALTGRAANLALSVGLSRGAFALNGSAVGVLAARRIGASPGVFSLTGSSAVLLRGLQLAATGASFVLTANAATFRRTLKISLGAGLFAAVGYEAALRYTSLFPPGPVAPKRIGKVELAARTGKVGSSSRVGRVARRA